MEASDQLHAPAAFFRGQCVLSLTEYKAVWAPEQIHRLFAKEKISERNRSTIPRLFRPEQIHNVLLVAFLN